jgi:hypothetical protein
MSPTLLYTLGGVAVVGTVAGFALLGRSKDEPAKKKTAAKTPPKEDAKPEDSGDVDDGTVDDGTVDDGTPEDGVGGFQPPKCSGRLVHQVYFDDSGLPAFTLANGGAFALEIRYAVLAGVVGTE